jgi:hypothetical protein
MDRPRARRSWCPHIRPHSRSACFANGNPMMGEDTKGQAQAMRLCRQGGRPPCVVTLGSAPALTAVRRQTDNPRFETAAAPGRDHVDQTVRTLLVEPDHPVPQRLPVHSPDPRRFRTRRPIQDRCYRQQPPRLRHILRSCRKPPQLCCRESCRSAMSGPWQTSSACQLQPRLRRFGNRPTSRVGNVADWY